MKKLLFSLLLCPLLSIAQPATSNFEKDNLYTTSGYKIYKGQILHLGTGSSAGGYFRYIKFHSSMGKNSTYTLQNSTIQVIRMKNYRNAGADDQNIRITGMITYTDGKKEEAELILEFENAIASLSGQSPELIVPAEFKIKRTIAVSEETVKPAPPAPVEVQKQPAPDELKRMLVADEIKKLFDLYKAGALTKEEYEKQKKKLLEQ